MCTINERIIEVRKYFCKGNNKAFAKTLCKQPNTTSNWTQKGYSVGRGVVSEIVDAFPLIDKDWLLTGEGGMLKGRDANIETLPAHTIRYWVDVEATAGGVQLFDDLVSNNHIDISIPEFRDCTDAVNLYGDSMLPLYKSGQIIILKEWKESFIDFGNVYLIITKEGNRMVKYLRKGADNDHWLCTSENEDFDPFEIEKSDILKLFLVKGSISKNVL